MFPVLILAGGLATRLSHLTASTPKSLIEVAGRPFIFWQLDYLREQNISSVVVCVGHMGDQIMQAVGDGSDFGLRVTYSRDGTEQLGTGGAIRNALRKKAGDIFILYGDSYLPIDFSAVQRSYVGSTKPVLMSITKNKKNLDESNVELRDHGSIHYNKKRRTPSMTHIDFGLSIVNVNFFLEYRSLDIFDLADFFTSTCEKGLLAYFETDKDFYEIGSVSGLERTRKYICNLKGRT